MSYSESSVPYLTTLAILVGLAILVFGVANHSYTIQGVGGVAIVAGILGLATYLDRLPDAEGSH